MKIEELYPKAETMEDKIRYVAKLKTQVKFQGTGIRSIKIGKKLVIVKMMYGSIAWELEDLMKEITLNTKQV